MCHLTVWPVILAYLTSLQTPKCIPNVSDTLTSLWHFWDVLVFWPLHPWCLCCAHITVLFLHWRSKEPSRLWRLLLLPSPRGGATKEPLSCHFGSCVGKEGRRRHHHHAMAVAAAATVHCHTLVACVDVCQSGAPSYTALRCRWSKGKAVSAGPKCGSPFTSRVCIERKNYIFVIIQHCIFYYCIMYNILIISWPLVSLLWNRKDLVKMWNVDQASSL